MAPTSNGIPRVEPKPSAAWERVLGHVLSSKLGTAFIRRFVHPIDVPLMRLTGGRMNSSFGSMPMVVLRTTGAKSGLTREVALAYFNDGDDVILIASNAGHAKHPNWYYNLLAHPECELLAEGRHDRCARFVARPADAGDRERLLALAQAYIASYGIYDKRLSGVRAIPVLRLAPV